jgi:hypothetical protein
MELVPFGSSGIFTLSERGLVSDFSILVACLVSVLLAACVTRSSCLAVHGLLEVEFHQQHFLHVGVIRLIHASLEEPRAG